MPLLLFRPFKSLPLIAFIVPFLLNCIHCSDTIPRKDPSYVHMHDQYSYPRRSIITNLLAKARPLSQHDDISSRAADEHFVQAPEFIQKRQLASSGSGLDDYSLKYVRCQPIETYSDDMASDYNATSVLSREDFVVLRLCPSSYCNDNFYFGCTNDYGDFIIQLADYLDIVYTYRVQSRENYCSLCQECSDRRRELEEEEEDNENQAEIEEDEGDDKSVEDNVGNDVEENDDGSSGGELTCDDFDSDCGKYCSSSTNQVAQYDDFFECTKFDGSSNYGKSISLYIGARCASDTTGIDIGIFYDQYCTQSAEDSYTLNDFTGIYFPDDGMADYSDTMCFRCDGQGVSFLVTACFCLI